MQRYDKIRQVVENERNSNIFKWQTLCKELNLKSKGSEMRRYAQMFGVPPQFWNNPRKICAIIAPRMNDYSESVACDNSDESSMDGDAVGGLPEFLKYTFIADNGKAYCYSVLDLQKAIQAGQQRDPYRRFNFTQDFVDDINSRVKFIKAALEPHAYGEGILSAIRNSVISTLPGSQLRSKLVDVWGKLRYPKYQVEEILKANESLLNGIMQSLLVHDGVNVLSQESKMFKRALDADAKRKVLIDVMARIVSLGDEVERVALEVAINESTPRGRVRSRHESNDDTWWERATTRRRTSDSESDEDSNVERGATFTHFGLDLPISFTLNPQSMFRLP